MIASVIAFLQIIARLLADLVGLIALSVRPRRSVEAENLFLRRELALYVERGIRPRRVDAATRLSLALLSRLFDWRDALVVVRPETMIRWCRSSEKLTIGSKYLTIRTQNRLPFVILNGLELSRCLTTHGNGDDIWLSVHRRTGPAVRRVVRYCVSKCDALPEYSTQTDEMSFS